ncbi:DNA circularization N-terminal domain-containing protein [Gluconacetobacter diazotrophicus]|uniref:DNA circularization N-terminal domain-containing protein n=1 Tax=Gluconacetobacter diazotrophicus TaxID=33996 RepID=UPI00119B7F8B|nr:DNA circularization N-terminal domain-containing protein [Gluconacetobacter diazotrophicus]TWA98246.1 hypothetical protein FBZ86_1475 [Gluconacetobacter diazotrophicus]
MSIFSDAKSVIYFGGAQVYIQSYRKSNGAAKFVKHLFPYSNQPYMEFVGYDAKTYEIEGFFQIDGLWSLLIPVYETIFSSQTPRTLTLPDVGMVQVVCENYSFSQTADANGIVRCNLTFVYAPVSNSSFSLISLIENPMSALTTLSTNGISSITSNFESSLSGMTLSNITGPIGDCLNSLGDTAQNLISTAGKVTGIDSLLSGMSLGRYAQDPMNPEITSGIDTSQSNADIISDVQASSSSFYSDTSSSVSNSISSANGSIGTLV